MQSSPFHKERNRLRTFANYPSSAIKSALVLAQSGFVYTGNGQEVTCVFCQAVKTSWRCDEDVEEVHLTLSPSCPLVTGQNCGNIPLTRTSSTSFSEILNEQLRSSQDHQVSANTNLSQQIETHSGSARSGNRESSTSTAVQNIQEPNGGFTANQDITSNSINVLDETSNGTIQNQEVSAAPSFNAVSQSNSARQTVEASPHQHDQNQHTNSNANGPTYSELGIITDRPKRVEYALKSERLKTYSTWPRGHRLQPSDLADAGFYFAGYGDCARCFYCGGGLRNWDDEDDVWVEHARWFPKCSFIRQRMGQVFVDTVQEMHKTFDKISLDAVTNKMGIEILAAYPLDRGEDTLRRDPAVRAVSELGIPQNFVIEMAKCIKAEDSNLSADKILAKINTEKKEVDVTPVGNRLPNVSPAFADEIEIIRRLKESNNILRQQTTCKICMDREVDIVFLPCGHLVSCTECAVAMKDCPVCRAHVRGTVRAFMS
ncbi:E3 ubiquitin-protein ligase XIAP [Biomphalaria pfeifferi]|uniref:E3 ubiquitin-protein ligase XIAP n=1 Tax=Biomphalaria pfeifferi TaxID=112525 RepID=A0AAD8AUV9_BIOPF|nr:E3 ubiquitin-protein ligase XIAP [Biomphalaria pfeifferi]